jgi:hypothetical protein
MLTDTQRHEGFYFLQRSTAVNTVSGVFLDNLKHRKTPFLGFTVIGRVVLTQHHCRSDFNGVSFSKPIVPVSVVD